uniref:Putative secreted protein n=1 Tax=Anopheles marajoara TaxID=58244 RepID=A0A2M4CCF4_9DIPT
MPHLSGFVCRFHLLFHAGDTMPSMVPIDCFVLKISMDDQKHTTYHLPTCAWLPPGSIICPNFSHIPWPTTNTCLNPST